MTAPMPPDHSPSGGTVINAQPLEPPAPLDSPSDAPSPALATRIDTLWRNAFTADALPSVTIRTDSLAGDAASPSTFGSPTLTLKTRTLSEPGRALAEAAEYELSHSIGQGGMAVVYEARQMAIDRTIALKMIRPDCSGDDLYRERFLYEAAVTGDLEHPNIIPIYDLGTNAQGHPFYAMRHINGTPWTRVMREKPLLENIAILMDVADAVAFAHSRGVLHRDLKPDNVMLGEYGEVLLIDWGIAVSFTDEGKAPRLSEATALGGTPSYMAPEMAEGEFALIGPHSDIYLLGAILYEIATGQKPHQGKSLREVLLNAAQNVIVPPARNDELLEIALQAMATAPADRPASVKAFQEAIREHLSHAESIAFSSRAHAILERARASGSYDEFGQALFTSQEALKLWEGNRAASQGLDATRLAWAECACAKGDLDLAETLLEAGGLAGSELGARVRELKAERRRIAEEVRALENQLANEAHREWMLAFEDDFTDPGVERRWEIVGEPWEWRRGELRLRGGRPQVLIARMPIDGDIRIEFECRQEGELLSGVTCFLAAPPDDDRDELDEQAYAFRIGATGNHPGGVYRLAKPLYESHGSALESGRRLRVRAERVGARLTLTANDRVICDLIDPEPLEGEGREVWGLAIGCVETIFTSIRAWRLGSPLKVDLLQWAEKYLARGRHETASDLFEDVIDSTAPPERIARARRGLRRAAELRELHRQLPELESRLKAAWPGAMLRIGDDGICLSIDHLDIEDLAPLAGLPIADLECEGNRITSLEPLYGMPLRRLICRDNAIATLEPLRGMPLHTLNCAGNRIASLEPLRGMPLVSLCYDGNPIENFDPLTSRHGRRSASPSPARTGETSDRPIP